MPMMTSSYFTAIHCAISVPIASYQLDNPPVKHLDQLRCAAAWCSKLNGPASSFIAKATSNCAGPSSSSRLTRHTRCRNGAECVTLSFHVPSGARLARLHFSQGARLAGTPTARPIRPRARRVLFGVTPDVGNGVGRETAANLFDNWFDPIEVGLRERVRDFLEEMFEGELDEVLSRRRYARRALNNG
jgi:hypothetical protein